MSEKTRAGLKRAGFMIVISVLLAVFVLAPLNIASLSDHECVCSCGSVLGVHCTCGGACSICAFISYISSFTNSSVALLAFFAFVHCMASMCRGALNVGANAQNDSPVKLRVKLSN